MNILIKNADLLSMKDGENIQNGVDIAIEGDTIRYIGDIPNDFIPNHIIDASGKLVMPGIINGHTHVAMSLFRNYADDLPLWEWLNDKIWPLEEKLSEEDIYWGTMLSIVEMIRSGVTSFADMYFFTDETAKAVKETGIRASLARGLAGGDNEDDTRLNEVKELYYKWNNYDDGRITIMAGPHAIYTCSPKYLSKVVKLAEELNIGIHIHLSESKKEVEESFDKYGKSPIEHVKDIGLFKLPTLAAHCVHVSDKDIDILAENNVSVVNNPTSNLKLANGFAPIEDMINKGINVALGTDGSSSNNNLNMFEEIHLASIINKSVNQSATSIPAYTAIKMATVNGAKALNLYDKVGTIETGKKADIIIIDMNKPHLCPKHNIISSLAYSAQASDVETVIINGKIIMENYEMKTVDIHKVMFNVKKRVRKLIQ